VGLLAAPALEPRDPADLGTLVSTCNPHLRMGSLPPQEVLRGRWRWSGLIASGCIALPVERLPAPGILGQHRV